MNTTIQMTENLNFLGRISRMVLGLALLTPIFFISGYVNAWSVIALLAIFPIVSALDGYCPLTNWYKKTQKALSSRLNKEQRVQYGLLATVLIGSIFVGGESGGSWLVLPLLGIYPAMLAIFGEKLVSAVIASTTIQVMQSATQQKVSAAILALKKAEKAADHHIDHAA